MLAFHPSVRTRATGVYPPRRARSSAAYGHMELPYATNATFCNTPFTPGDPGSSILVQFAQHPSGPLYQLSTANYQLPQPNKATAQSQNPFPRFKNAVSTPPRALFFDQTNPPRLRFKFHVFKSSRFPRASIRATALPPPSVPSSAFAPPISQVTILFVR